MGQLYHFPENGRSSPYTTLADCPVLHQANRLKKQIKKIDRLARLSSSTGAFRPMAIRTYCEDYDMSTACLPASGRGLTTPELVAHLDLVLSRTLGLVGSNLLMPARLSAALKDAQVEALSAINQMVGGLMSSDVLRQRYHFDVEEYELMRAYARAPAQKFGVLVSYALRLANEACRRLDQA